MVKSLGQVSDTDIRTLRIFRTVVECGGFAASEVELNISRAAISIAMSDLETRLGFKLAQRGRAGFALTIEGQQVYDYTLQLLSSIENFRTQVNALHANLKGELTIGITDNLVSMPHMLVTQALAKLKEKGPDVRINIRMIPPNEVERGILDGKLHVGIIPALKILDGLLYRPLYDERSNLYCSAQHPFFDIEFGDDWQTLISTHDAVVPAYAQAAETKIRQQQLKGSASATDREGVAFLILTGKYIGYLPDHYAKRWVDANEMKALLPDKMSYQTKFSAITRSTGVSNLVLDTFLQELDALCSGRK
ncbi:LysR family transcriptional regulator [Maribrevibacterium harenarium]|uniref:LysR family transcriptional regulator n=1 Tax=Maribrevibacterium harenarium TaxID=2589817 RepID=A0A501WMQ9_9GAMM|nr:LysR family transcriptional regulator [Maribrevibacterium harenarium]TPE49474.1 LysR family transcriptional regulator [Maribrevibacterium harenarium]